jgi:hypothetical protein
MHVTLHRLFFERGNPAAVNEHKDLFRDNNLAIIHDYRFDQEFGKYPVLYVDSSVSELLCHFPSR